MNPESQTFIVALENKMKLSKRFHDFLHEDCNLQSIIFNDLLSIFKYFIVAPEHSITHPNFSYSSSTLTLSFKWSAVL